MMPSADDDVSLREIARNLADFRNEFRTQLSNMMRTDVYRAEQAAYELRLTSLEKDRDLAENGQAATRRLALGALLSCAVTVIAALLILALTR